MAPYHWCSLLLWIQTTRACTVFIVGKDASADGSVMVTHSNDGEFNTDPRLVKVPAFYHPHGAMRPVYFSPEDYPRYVGTERGIPAYFPDPSDPGTSQSFEPIGSIPQVPHTYSYLEETYGTINEHQVGIGESTCSGIFGAVPLGAPNGTALFSIDELTHLAMERATTAAEAIDLMGRLAVEHGFYGAGEFEGTAESLAVSDPNEAWIFHILPDPTGRSAIWAAQRVPSDGFTVLANMFVIREIDPSDPANFKMSHSVFQVARDYGWWDPETDGLLDFTKIYSDGEYAHKYYSGRRMWGGYRRAGLDFPSDYVDLQSDPVYPVYARPPRKISVADLFDFHRDYYQGTEFDLSQIGALAGGPFGTPDRWKEGPGEAQVSGNWERPIGLFRTSDTYVVQSFAESDKNQEGVLWYALGSPLGSIFTPFVVSMEDIPASFGTGHQSLFSRKTAFWAATAVQNLANLKWSYMIEDIQAVQKEWETQGIQLLLGDETTRRDQKLAQHADAVTSALWDLSDALLFKYASGFVNERNPDGGGMSQMVGYPAWWLKAVGYPDGPPPPPTQPKCCHPERRQQPLKVMTGKAAMKEYLRRREATATSA